MSAIGVLLLYATAIPVPSAGSPTPTATPCIGQYVNIPIEDSCVPGETDIGNHGDDTITTVALPFPYTVYDHVQLDQSVVQRQCAVHNNG